MILTAIIIGQIILTLGVIVFGVAKMQLIKMKGNIVSNKQRDAYIALIFWVSIAFILAVIALLINIGILV